MERTRTTKVQPIRWVDGVELPVEGSWRAPRSQPVALSVRRGIRRSTSAGRVVGGSLELGRDLAATTLTLDIETLDGIVHVRATGVGADNVDRWDFAGTLERDGESTPITVCSTYHGVFRNGDGYVAWLTIDVDCRHPLGRTRLGGELNFSAPAPVEPDRRRAAHPLAA